MEIERARPMNLYDLSRPALGKYLSQWGYSDYHAAHVWSGLYRSLAVTTEAMPDLRPELRDQLAAGTVIGIPTVRNTIDSADGHTRKFLMGLADGQAIETVLMYFRGRATVCISTQVGCAMGCVFCATGQMGFRRHLTPG